MLLFLQNLILHLPLIRVSRYKYTTNLNTKPGQNNLGIDQNELTS